MGCGKGVEEAIRHRVNNLASLYTIQSKSNFPALLSPIPQSMRYPVTFMPRENTGKRYFLWRCVTLVVDRLAF